MVARTKKKSKKAAVAYPAPLDLHGDHLGIDPGINGGLAYISHQGGGASAIRMPTVRGMDGRARLDLNAIANSLRRIGPSYAVIELVSPAPCEGRSQGVTGMFSFGRGYGELLGILATLGIVTVEIRPQAWKKLVLPPLLTEADKQAAKDDPKAASLAFVARKYPEVCLIPPRCRKPHDGIADAVCLAHLSREIARGDIVR